MKISRLLVIVVILCSFFSLVYGSLMSYSITVGGSSSITPLSGMTSRTNSHATYDAWGNLKIGTPDDPYTCSAQGSVLVLWTFDEDQVIDGISNPNPGPITCYASDGNICSSSPAYTINHDTSSSSCAICGFNYNVGSGDCSYSGCTTQCCGDDAGEYYRTQHGHGNDDSAYGNIAWTNVANIACCDANDNIDYNGNCVDSYSSPGTGRAVFTGIIGDDKYSASYYGGSPSNGWLECDYYASTYCANACGGGTFVLAGEAVGEYSPGTVTDNGGRTDQGSNIYGYAECCGDDDGEFYIDDRATPGSTVACCNDASDCVDDIGGVATCILDDNGVASYSDDSQYYCTSGNWLSVDDSQALCAISFIWLGDYDYTYGTNNYCCGDDGASDDFGSLDDSTDVCHYCLDGSVFSENTCLAAGTKTVGATGDTSDDICYYDGVDLDSDRGNDCSASGCEMTTDTFDSIAAGLTSTCQFNSPGEGDTNCLTDDNVVSGDTTYDYCYFNIACASLGIAGWYADNEPCRDTNYVSDDVPLNYQCYYEQYGTLQGDRSDDCTDSGCTNIDVCSVGLGEICKMEPGAGSTGCITDADECDLDCMALGYNNGTVIDEHTCNCGISNFTAIASSTSLVPLESNDTVTFNATATNADLRLDYESQPVDIDICQNFACGSLLYPSYTEENLPGDQEVVSFTESVPFCDYRGAGVYFFMKITDSVGNYNTVVSDDVYYIRKTDGCLCAGNEECYSDFEANGGCDSDDGWCFSCKDKIDSIDLTCEYDDDCGAAITCDELDPFSCVPYVGWCNGTSGCGSNPNVVCTDEIVLDSGTSDDICTLNRNESTAHCGCIDDVDEGQSCDNNFDGSLIGGSEGICVDSECVESLAVQINVGNVSGLNAEYDATCDFNDGKPCVNDVEYEFFRDGTCAATDAGATTFECDDVGHIAFDGVNYFNSCNLVADGTGCDSNASRIGTNDLYSQNGICTGGQCCEAGFVDVNNNTLFDDPGACGTFGESVEGYLCDQNIDFIWDGYVVYNITGDVWYCSNQTPFSFYDSKSGDFGDEEVTLGCDVITGPFGSQGRICDNSFVPTTSFWQDGLCVMDDMISFSSCDTFGHSVYDSSLMVYTSDCNTSRNYAGGFVCDTTVLGGDFVGNGFCALNISQSRTICHVGLVSSDCDVGVCNITNNQSYVGCTAGLACGDSVTGFNWYQEGTCLNSTFCDKSTEIVYDGSQFLTDCENNTYLDCDSDVVVGNYKKDGQCYAGYCDNSIPTLVGPMVTNVSVNSWFSNSVHIDCLGASDIGSGINTSSYLFQYASTHTPLETDWQNISSCINTTYNCTWNVSSILLLDNLTLRCRVSDLSWQDSLWLRSNFSGIDTVAPRITLGIPADDVEVNSPLLNFTFDVSDNNNNGTLDNCVLTIYDNMTHGVFKTYNFIHPYEGVNSVEFTGLTKGNYYWNIGCYDLAMNYNISESREIVVKESEYFVIEPLSETGFINASKKYTVSRVVHLIVSLSNHTDRCSFKNENGDWTPWESCDVFKSWILTEGAGVKTVYANISHKPPFENVYLIYTDSIFYDPTGQFLDSSGPEILRFEDAADYTDSSVGFSVFVKAQDLEDKFYNSKLQYKLNLIEYNGIINQTVYSNLIFEPDSLTDEYFIDFESLGLNLSDGYTYYAMLNVTNRANLSSIAYTDGITVDLQPPVNLTITSPTHPFGVWTSNNTVIFHLNDTDLFLEGYSILLDHSSSSEPDNYVDITNNDITYSNLPDGYYYFTAKSKDMVGNWGLPVSYSFGVDVTPPSSPYVINSPQRATGNYIEFCWTPGKDEDSGIITNHVSVYDWNSNLVASTTTGSDCYLFESAVQNIVYFVKVVAENGAGLYSDGGSSLNSLEITHVKPRDLTNGVAIVDTSEPILVVKTNKNAVCNYAINGVSYSFLFTDYLHHETVIDNLDENVVTDVQITCIDSIGNVKMTDTSIKYETRNPDLLSVSNLDDVGFTGQVLDFDVIVTDDGVGLGEISKSDFNLELLDENETNFVNEFVLEDMGAGVYKFYVILPKLAGLYTLSLKLNGLSFTKELEVADLNFNVVFDFVEEKGDLVLSNLVAKNVGLFTVGLASEGEKLDLETNDDLIQLDTRYEDGVIYLFVVDNNDKLKKMSSLLKDGSLLDLISPSFGDFMSEEIVLNAELFYTDVEFRKEFSLTNGRYVMYLSNKGLGIDNDTEISINSK